MKNEYIKRLIHNDIEKIGLDNHKMVFLSGPRQAGKTTLAKELLKQKSNYFNWDAPQFRKQWSKDPLQFGNEILSTRDNLRIVLDELHKQKKWRNSLKGFYDHFKDQIEIIVTGSAKLNTYQKGSDSLLGRFFHMHVLPFTLGEISGNKNKSYSDFSDFIQDPELNSKSLYEEIRKDLFQYSGFPEPFLKQDKSFQNLWQKNRNELLIRQDVRDLSATISIHQIEILADMLPEKVGAPLSLQSLVEDLEGAYNSIKKWMGELEKVYYHFEIRPFVGSIARSLKKEKKIYLYDWTQVQEESFRFENMVALHLLKLVHYYNDTGQGNLNLWYLRNKEKQEVDFCVTHKLKPLFTVEVKLNDTQIDTTYKNFQKYTKSPHFQIINKSNYLRKYKNENHLPPAYVMGFSDFFRWV